MSRQYSSLPSHDNESLPTPGSSSSTPRKGSRFIPSSAKASSSVSRIAVWIIGGWLAVVIVISAIGTPSLDSLRRRPGSGTGGSAIAVGSADALAASSSRAWSIAIAQKSHLRVHPPPMDAAEQDDRHLSQASCQLEFPLLYQQLADNVEWWNNKGGIKLEHVDEAFERCRLGCARILIKDGLIWIKNFRWPMQTRVRELLTLFKQAVEGATYAELQALDGAELVINGFDFELEGSSRAAWVLTKKISDGDGQFLLPDFGFGGWPEAAIGTYSEYRKNAKKVVESFPWEAKGNRAFFRGDPNVGSGNPARLDLMKQIHKPGAEVWADVARTSFGGTGEGEPIAPFVSIEDHCKHKYLLHSEGVTYSGRSKYILGCASAVITHDLIWTQHYHPALISNQSSPDQNLIVSPGEHFSKLAELMIELQRQDKVMASQSAISTGGLVTPSLGYTVGSNANRTLTNRYLTPAGIACYTRAALIAYASVLQKHTFGNGMGPQINPGGGLTQFGSGNMWDFKDKIKGDIELGSWFNVGMPEWPM